MSFPKGRKKSRNLLNKRTFSVNLDEEIVEALDEIAEQQNTCRSAIVADVLAKSVLIRASREPGAEDERTYDRNTAKIEITVCIPGEATRSYEAFVPKHNIKAQFKEICENITIEP